MASSRWAASRIPPSCVACSIRSSLHGTCTATPTNHSLSISDTIWTSLAPRGLGGARVWSEAQHSALRASISSSVPWSGVDCRSERAKSHVGVGTSSVPVSISSRAPARVWNEKRQHGSILSSVPWSGVDCTRCERSRRCAEAGNASISRTLLRRTGLAGARVTESGGEGRHNAADVGGLLLGRPSLGCGSRTGGLRTFGVGAGGPSASAAMTEEELKNLKLDDGDVVADSDKGKGIEEDAAGSSGRKTLEDLNWDHSFVRDLPGDSRTDGPVRQVLHACYTKVTPSVHVKNPELVAWSEPVADILDLDSHEFARPDFPSIFSGATPLKGGSSYAQCYGGHQFGVWAGQLGDGRAITLGELLNSKGERWELQLKGAGKTPYSRTADGLAVLRSSVREFLCSEAMYHLGVPTTRALCLVTTGEGVLRDMFYDGNVKMEPGAVVCRVAPSFIRFGSFQIHAARDKSDLPLVKQLADYTIHNHYPQYESLPFERQALEEGPSQALNGDKENPLPQIDISKNRYAAWFTEVGERTAVMIAKWQAVGFTHGVMNTDNMSILGLTIDYGPFGFLDAFDPKYTPNTTDLPGRRYGFANQPDIGLWNVMQLANTLYTAELITAEEAQYGLGRYADKFMSEYQQHMSNKIGLKAYHKDLLSKLLNNMAFDKVDYTNFFRSLGNLKAGPGTSDDELIAPLKNALLDLSKERRKVWLDWLHQYIELLLAEGVPEPERKAQMDSVNPKYVLRNYLCQSAIDLAEQGDYTEVQRLLKVMERPYDDQPGMEKYARLPPAWAYRPGGRTVQLVLPELLPALPTMNAVDDLMNTITHQD